VRLVEARSRLGGRGRSLERPYAANLGPHALYATTELWPWLRARKLHQPAPMPKSPAVYVRWRGKVRRTPPAALLRAVRLCRRPAPVDRDLRSWATDQAGPDVAQVLCGLAGPLTFDPDPGRLSADFVVSRIRRILLKPLPSARYVAGGWSALIERLAAHASTVGVQIETGSPVASLDDVGPGPVIVALDPPAARRLLGDDSLRAESPRVALLDVGLARRRRRDPYIVFDLDESVFLTRVTAVVRSMAPGREQLLQLSAGSPSGEGLAAAEARLEAVLDAGFRGWRDRATWRRRGLVTESTGALDLPGTTWHDRTPIVYGEGVWLAGDWVAAPGHLAEVSWASAVTAARAAVDALATATSSRPSTPGLSRA
jgi:hypothetical protein